MNAKIATHDWSSPAVSAADAVASIRSGMNVFVHGGSATPTPLLEALAKRRDLEGVTLYHLHTMGPAPFVAPEHAGRFRSVSLFTGQPVRSAVQEGRADFIPVFLSDVPGLFTSGRIRLDVALLQLTPPDAHGLVGDRRHVVRDGCRWRRRRCRRRTRNRIDHLNRRRGGGGHCRLVPCRRGLVAGTA